MAACFRQQRTVVTVPQILVAATQVNDLDALAGLDLKRLFQVLLGTHHVLRGKVRGPVFLSFDNNNHLAGSSRRLL
ncbi:hypothetical protein D3C80_1798680 [compost metagenome]